MVMRMLKAALWTAIQLFKVVWRVDPCAPQILYLTMVDRREKKVGW